MQILQCVGDIDCSNSQFGMNSHRELANSAVDVDPTTVRVIWAALSVVPGGLVGGILVYLLAWIIIPRALAATTASGAPLETF